MQCFGSFTQSMLQRNLSPANQPMGGVTANPLWRQIQNEERCSSSNQANTNSIPFLNIKKLVLWQICNHILYFHSPSDWLKSSSTYVVVIKWEKTIEFIAFTLLTNYLLRSPSGMKTNLQKDTVKILKGKTWWLCSFQSSAAHSSKRIRQAMKKQRISSSFEAQLLNV